MKIGIFTYHRAQNYGAFLQAYALCERLNQESDMNAEIIDFRMCKEVKHYKNRITISTFVHPYRFYNDCKNNISQRVLFEEDIKKLRISKRKIISDSTEVFRTFVDGKYDVIIVGSDEVWKINGFRGFPTPYWLIGELKCRKFAYAVSSRNKFDILSMDKLQILSKAINEFEFIGVRDKATLAEVKKYSKRSNNVFLCCDPTFLHEFKPDPEHGRSILNKKLGKIANKKYIGIMTEDIKIAKILKSRIGDEYELFSLYQWQPGCINACNLSPFDWLDVLSALDLVVTSFFHAVCFASKFGIPLIAFGTRGKSDKVLEILERMNRSDEFINDIKLFFDSNNINNLLETRINLKKEPYKAEESMYMGFEFMLEKLRS